MSIHHLVYLTVPCIFFTCLASADIWVCEPYVGCDCLFLCNDLSDFLTLLLANSSSWSHSTLVGETQATAPHSIRSPPSQAWLLTCTGNGLSSLSLVDLLLLRPLLGMYFLSEHPISHQFTRQCQFPCHILPHFLNYTNVHKELLLK